MRAKQDGNVLMFELEGHLDFETTQQFEETCASMIGKTEKPRVVFNMEKLKFVGSSGINQFIKVIKEFNTQSNKPRLVNLSSEFVKMFRAYQTARNPFEIHETLALAVASFDAVPVPKKPGRKKSNA